MTKFLDAPPRQRSGIHRVQRDAQTQPGQMDGANRRLRRGHTPEDGRHIRGMGQRRQNQGERRCRN